MKKLTSGPLGPDDAFAIVSTAYFFSVILLMIFTFSGKT